jgi:hypothetical protein
VPIDGAVVQVGKADGGGGESHRSAVGSDVLSVTHGISTRGNKNLDECGVVNMCSKVLCEVVTNWILCVIESISRRLTVCVKLQIILTEVVDCWCVEERNGRRDDVSDTFVFCFNMQCL